MKTVLVLLLIALLTGCAGTFGHSHYEVAPFMLDGRQTCCKIVIDNGKEIGALDATFIKKGDDWTIRLKEAGVKAFEGQAIGADIIKPVVPSPLLQDITK